MTFLPLRFEELEKHFFCSGFACNSCPGANVTATAICCLVYSCDGRCDGGIARRLGCQRESVNSSGVEMASASAARRSVAVSLIWIDWELSLAVIVCANGCDFGRARVWVIANRQA